MDYAGNFGPSEARKAIDARRAQHIRVVRAEITAKRVADGVCNACGGPRVPGRLLCEHHMEYQVNYRREQRARRRRHGLCILCPEGSRGGPVPRLAVFGDLCAKHRIGNITRRAARAAARA
jgi:hypothetical protein